MAAVEQFLGGDIVASWMRQSGKALRDYVRSADAAPIWPSDIMGNAMECPRGDRLAYRLWGIILDSQHAQAQRYVSDDSSRADLANPLDALSWSDAVQRGGPSFKNKGIDLAMRQGVLHWVSKKGRWIPVSPRPSGDWQRCAKTNVPQEQLRHWHCQCPYWSSRDCGLCGRTGSGWPCWCSDSRSVARSYAPLPSHAPAPTFKAAAACQAMAMAAVGPSGWQPWAYGDGHPNLRRGTSVRCPHWLALRGLGRCSRRLLTRCLSSWHRGSVWDRLGHPSVGTSQPFRMLKMSNCSRNVYGTSYVYGRLVKLGKPTPGQPYMGPCGLRLLWFRALSPQD